MWYDRYLMGVPLRYTRISAKKAARMENEQEFLNQFQDLFSTAMNLFRWEGLPPTCDERTIERSLLLTGRAMIAEYDSKLISLPAVNGANLNLYGYPLTVWGYGVNGFNHEFRAFVPGADDGKKVLTSSPAGNTMDYRPEAVVGWDNVDAFPYVSYLFLAAARLADLIRSCDVAVRNLKCPLVVQVDESQVQTTIDLFRNRDDNLPVILGGKSLAGIKPEVLNMSITPDTLTAFWDQYRNIKNEVLEVLGINANDNEDKKERLLVDEVNANNEEINHNLQKRLEQRLIWADRVNEFFGLSIKPHLAKEDWAKEVETEEEVESDVPDGQSGGMDPGDPGAAPGMDE